MLTDSQLFLANLLLSIFSLCIVYLIYQLLRNQKVGKIRLNWLDKKDPRLSKYTYEEMFLPSKKNRYGLQMPEDKDFK